MFDKAEVHYELNSDVQIIENRHKRLKIFNEAGKSYANVRIEYFHTQHFEEVLDLKAQTINLTNGKTEITKLDKKSIYVEQIDKFRSAIVFAFPNVQPGSVVEYQYKWKTLSLSNFPTWYFQDLIPVRYSQLTTSIPDNLDFKRQSRNRQPYVINTTVKKNETLEGTNTFTFNVITETKALEKVHSLPNEPYMSSLYDNLKSISFTLSGISELGSKYEIGTWKKIVKYLSANNNFGAQLNKKLPDEQLIIAKANQQKNQDERIAYLFNHIKTAMKSNALDYWDTNDGVVKAWEKKTGNATEINMMLFHLLKQVNIPAYPMLVSTRKHGKVNPYNPVLNQFNRTVVYIPVDSSKCYVLDASNKFNLYNEIPDNTLNSFGFYYDTDKEDHDLVFIQNEQPVRQACFVNAEIKPDGKMVGTAQLSSFGYNKINRTTKYKTDGENKFIEYLKGKDNSLTITSVKFENTDTDTLPLVQNVNFSLDLTNSDDKYLYFKVNALTSLEENPFVKENRFTDIDYGYRDNYTISGMYKIPAGYKPESLPQNASLTMPDGSMSFKRIVSLSDDNIIIRFTIDHLKTIYFKEDYPEFREFNKKMYEMLNEPIALKKS
ncbi:DUF3857 domain-containing protein [Mucilaginibacter gynuensis]|uniref:DUF3857 domain-containing protein n=1 Tax=Mucilaginibacter gynuensis TaxID=1302236 RepID=UPI0031EF51AE